MRLIVGLALGLALAGANAQQPSEALTFMLDSVAAQIGEQAYSEITPDVRKMVDEMIKLCDQMAKDIKEDQEAAVAKLQKHRERVSKLAIALEHKYYGSDKSKRNFAVWTCKMQTPTAQKFISASACDAKRNKFNKDIHRYMAESHRRLSEKTVTPNEAPMGSIAGVAKKGALDPLDSGTSDPALDEQGAKPWDVKLNICRSTERDTLIEWERCLEKYDKCKEKEMYWCNKSDIEWVDFEYKIDTDVFSRGPKKCQFKYRAHIKDTQTGELCNHQRSSTYWNHETRWNPPKTVGSPTKYFPSYCRDKDFEGARAKFMDPPTKNYEGAHGCEDYKNLNDEVDRITQSYMCHVHWYGEYKDECNKWIKTCEDIDKECQLWHKWYRRNQTLCNFYQRKAHLYMCQWSQLAASYCHEWWNWYVYMYYEWYGNNQFKSSFSRKFWAGKLDDPSLAFNNHSYIDRQNEFTAVAYVRCLLKRYKDGGGFTAKGPCPWTEKPPYYRPGQVLFYREDYIWCAHVKRFVEFSGYAWAVGSYSRQYTQHKARYQILLPYVFPKTSGDVEFAWCRWEKIEWNSKEPACKTVPFPVMEIEATTIYDEKEEYKTAIDEEGNSHRVNEREGKWKSIGWSAGYRSKQVMRDLNNQPHKSLTVVTWDYNASRTATHLMNKKSIDTRDTKICLSASPTEDVYLWSVPAHKFGVATRLQKSTGIEAIPECNGKPMVGESNPVRCTCKDKKELVCSPEPKCEDRIVADGGTEMLKSDSLIMTKAECTAGAIEFGGAVTEEKALNDAVNKCAPCDVSEFQKDKTKCKSPCTAIIKFELKTGAKAFGVCSAKAIAKPFTLDQLGTQHIRSFVRPNPYQTGVPQVIFGF